MNKLEPSVLCEQIKEAMVTFGFNSATLEYYEKTAFQPIRSYFSTCNQQTVSLETLKCCTLQARQKYEDGKLSYHSFSYLRKAVSMMEELFMTGTLEWRELPNWKGVDLNTYFTEVLETYVCTKKRAGCHSDSTLKIYKGINFQFLRYLNDHGHIVFSTVTLKDAGGFIPYIANSRPSGMQGVMTALRSFCKFLMDVHLTEINLLSAFGTAVAPRRKVIFGFTRDEVDAILNAVDKETAIGKRDYAILLLAKKTGLRSADITNLLFSNIDWKNDMIHIIQRKTRRPLILPLEFDVDNALYDYILHGRPVSKSSHIFIRMRPPYQRLTEHSSSMNSIICKYMDAGGVSHKAVERKGFHSFRRSLGTRMLENEVHVIPG